MTPDEFANTELITYRVASKYASEDLAMSLALRDLARVAGRVVAMRNLVRDRIAASSEVKSPTSTSTEVRSPTSTSTEVRSPTNTSTEAYTADNFTATVTGGAGDGSSTTVNIYPVYVNRKPRSDDGVAAFPSHEVQPPETIKDMIHEIMSSPPPTGVIKGMMGETHDTPEDNDKKPKPSAGKVKTSGRTKPNSL